MALLSLLLYHFQSLGEFNHFADEEEFVNFNNDEDHEDEFEHMSTKGRGAKEKPRARPTAAPPKTIKITNIPAHLRNNVGICCIFIFRNSHY